ncbi:MAG: hypothetical protein AAF799_22250 [Myxococcota bacterium]
MLSAWVLGLALLGDPGAGELGAGESYAEDLVGSCDPEVVRARATALMPELAPITATVHGAVIFLEIETLSGETGALALQVDGDQFVTSSSATRLPEELGAALTGLGPALAEDPIVVAELTACEVEAADKPEDSIVALIQPAERRTEAGSFELEDMVAEWDESTKPRGSAEDDGAHLLARVPWLLLWVFLLGTGLATWLARSRRSDGAERGWVPLPSPHGSTMLAIMAGAMAVTGVYLAMSGHGLPIRHDSMRDLAVARDFWVEGVGPGSHSSSIPGIQHGRLWPMVLGALRSMGADLGTISWIRDLSAALAAALCAVLAVRLHGVGGAWAAALAAGLLGPWLAVHPLLWNPAMATLPLAALFLSCSLLLERGGPSLAVAAGAMAGLAMQAHPTNVFAIPLVAGIASLRARSTFDALLAANAAFLTIAIIDPESVLSWRSTESAGPLPVVIALGVPVGVGLGGLVRGRFERLSAVARQRVLIYVATVLVVSAIGAAAILVELPRRHYFAAVVPGVACFAGFIGARLLSLIPNPRWQVAAWLAAGAVAYNQGPEDPEQAYGLEDVELLAKALHARGVPRDRVGLSVQAPSRFAHVVGLALLYPDTPLESERQAGQRPIVAFMFPDEPPELPGGWERVPLASHVAVLGLGPEPWVQRGEFEACGQIDGERWCQPVVDAGQLDPEATWHQRARNMDVSPWPEAVDPATVMQRLTVRTADEGTRYLILRRGWDLVECSAVECSATDYTAESSRTQVIELTSPGPVEAQLVLKQREVGPPEAIVGLVAELEQLDPWMVESLRLR